MYRDGSFVTSVSFELDTNETEVEVSYEIIPEERRSWDSPGFPAEVVICGIEPVRSGDSISDYAWQVMMDCEGEEYGRLCEMVWEHETVSA